MTLRALKEASLGDRIRMVRGAWYNTFVPKAPSQDARDYWVAEVYEDRVIVEMPPDGYFSYTYTISDADEIEFGEPEQVKREVDYVAVKHAVKLLDELPDSYLVGGYGHVWGDVTLKDLMDDYFTPDSDLMPDLVAVKLVMFDHAMSYAPDGDWFDHPVGKAVESQTFTDDTGKWINAQLSKRAQYVDEVMALIDKGALAWSSGAVPHLTKRRPDGWLERWPVVEYSLTPTPAEPRMTDISRMKAAYKAAGIDVLWDLVKAHLPIEGQTSEGEDDNSAARLRTAQAKLRLLKLKAR
jgi:hypothetical protein